MLSETPEKEANLSIEFEAKEVNDAIGDYVIQDIEKLKSDMRSSTWGECVSYYSMFDEQGEEIVDIIRKKLNESGLTSKKQIDDNKKNKSEIMKRLAFSSWTKQRQEANILCVRFFEKATR